MASSACAFARRQIGAAPRASVQPAHPRSGSGTRASARRELRPCADDAMPASSSGPALPMPRPPAAPAPRPRRRFACDHGRALPLLRRPALPLAAKLWLALAPLTATSISSSAVVEAIGDAHPHPPGVLIPPPRQRPQARRARGEALATSSFSDPWRSR